MLRGTKIENNKNISVKTKIKKYDKPDYVYIPLKTYKNNKFDVLVKEGDYVLKGQEIARSKDKYDFPIHSSVSGIVKEIINKNYIDNKKVKSIVIENDFLDKEEKIGSKKKINTYTKEQVIEIIKNCGVVGMSGDNFPTYYKYNHDLKINKLVINAVESESYLTSDFVTLSIRTSEILETIDALMEIFDIKECVIAIKDFNKRGIENLQEYVGSYPNISIRVVKDNYTLGWEKYLIEYLFNIKVKKYPMEKSILVNNVSTIYSIYKALKYRKPITQRLVTFSGNALKNPQNIIVKIGTPINEIIDSIGGYKKNTNPIIIVNGPIMGNMIVDDTTVITKEVAGIAVLDNKDNIEEMDCINCGKCINICPVQISPVLIMDEKNNKNIKRLHPEKCINCGLCSYICPSKIDLRKKVLDKVGK